MRRFACILVASLALGAGSAFALDYSFRNVADTDGAYTNFGGAPVINDDGDVAFVASLGTGVQGIFSGPFPGTDTVVDDEGAFDSPIDSPSINAEGTIAFRAWLDPTPEDILGGRGIFTGADPELDLVADDNGVEFGDFDTPSIADDGTVAFAAILPNGDFGIYSGGDPVADLVADTSGPYANPMFAAAINDEGTVAFYAALDSGAGGIFTGDDPLNDTVATSAGPYAAFDIPAINDAGTVIFLATLDAGGKGIYRGPSPIDDKVVDIAGPYADFDAWSINAAGTVVFSASLDAGTVGLFTGPDPVADKVVAEGDPLFGSTVAFVSLLTENLNDNGEIAFSYVLADGLRGVAVARPGSLERSIGASEPFAGVRLTSAAGRDTVARLREGTAGADRELSLGFTPGDSSHVGDVLELGGTANDLYVLALEYGDADLAAAGSPDESALSLFWRDPGDGVWKEATLGNTPPGGTRLSA